MNTNALSDIFTLDSQLIAMLDAVSRGAMVPGCADITIRAYDERLHIALPDAPCIYIYALCNPAQTVPYALYIGQSLRHAAVRLDEHLRQCKTAADRYMREELDAGNALRVVVLCAPADALNELERTGYRWLMEHAYSARIMNADTAGANHCVRGAGEKGSAPVTLRSVMDYGAAVARFPLTLVSDELDALENALTPDALRDLDALAALNIPFGLQAVSVSAYGAPRLCKMQNLAPSVANAGLLRLGMVSAPRKRRKRVNGLESAKNAICHNSALPGHAQWWIHAPRDQCLYAHTEMVTAFFTFAHTKSQPPELLG